KGTKRQFQQGSGDRENITVIVTICTDGTALQPTIIFKGQNHMKKWANDNVSNAFNLAIEWFKKDFDVQTRDKANGESRALILDGHNSHYPTNLLQYALEADVLIIGYPSHSTHGLQGLNVICFSRMKDIYREEIQAFDQLNQCKMIKADFAKVFGKAYLRTFTPELIKMAFRVTGVYPFNPDVISEAQTKPSEALSIKGSFPLPQPSPVR
ncbi:hypothetical protein M422DRAFT_137261, partial [Sphaerobolus stellatus SS14]